MVLSPLVKVETMSAPATFPDGLAEADGEGDETFVSAAPVVVPRAVNAAGVGVSLIWPDAGTTAAAVEDVNRKKFGE